MEYIYKVLRPFYPNDLNSEGSGTVFKSTNQQIFQSLMIKVLTRNVKKYEPTNVEI